MADFQVFKISKLSRVLILNLYVATHNAGVQDSAFVGTIDMLEKYRLIRSLALISKFLGHT